MRVNRMKKFRILCVDDEPQNLRLLEAMLVPRGYDVVSIDSPSEALLATTSKQFDLVLLDVMMPVINGYEVCKAIKENIETRDIPVVLITSLNATSERIKGIEAGADDFISKPFSKEEVLARVKMLLKVKSLGDQMQDTYQQIHTFTDYGKKVMVSFEPRYFSPADHIESILVDLVRKNDRQSNRPALILTGHSLDTQQWTWELISWKDGIIKISIPGNFHKYVRNSQRRLETRIINSDSVGLEKNRDLITELTKYFGTINNVAVFSTNKLSVLCINYNTEISEHEILLMDHMIMQVLFMESISDQIQQVNNGYQYTIHSLARASEVNDEDTGNHIHRVGEYAYLLGKHMGLPSEFCDSIRIQASLHDVGKIHIPSEILKKPGPLTQEEFEVMKDHTKFGQSIIGDNKWLDVAAKTAVSHHEKWDGSGYPYGLKEKDIPIEGRLVVIADIYDALRNPRVYKLPFDHKVACRIIEEGDGRVLPEHFDPNVLYAFKECKSRLDNIYNDLKD